MVKYPRFNGRLPGACLPCWLPVLAAALMLAGCSDATDATGASAENQRPVFATSDGGQARWDEYRGGWVLVNYWAEWCKPCLEEIPELNDVNGIDGVTVMAVNFDGITGDELVELGERMGIRFTMLTDDPAPVLGWSMPGALPVTFVVNPDGELSETLLGPQTEEGLLALMGLESH